MPVRSERGEKKGNGVAKIFALPANAIMYDLFSVPNRYSDLMSGLINYTLFCAGCSFEVPTETTQNSTDT